MTDPQPQSAVQQGAAITSLAKVIGNARAVRQLQTALDAYWQERSMSSHPEDVRLGPILLCSPPGLGKTTFGHVLAHELQGTLHEQLAANVNSPMALRAELFAPSDGDLVFWDELQDLLLFFQNGVLLRALETGELFLDKEQRGDGKPIKLSNFIFVGATTDPQKLSKPLRERFKMVVHLEFYSPSEICALIAQRAARMNWNVEPSVNERIGALSRGVPRTAVRLLESARRFSLSHGSSTITLDDLTQSMDIDGLEPVLGLDQREQQYLRLLATNNDATRLNVIATTMDLARTCITETVEPFLVRSGLVLKTDKGRMLTKDGVDFARSTMAEK